MHPFRNPIHWILAPRAQHLVAIVENAPHLYAGPTGRRRKRRVKALRVWLGVRRVIFFLLVLGLVGALVASTPLVFLDTAKEWLRRTATMAAAFSGFLTLLLMGVSRTLGQLEMDVLASLAVETKLETPADAGDSVPKQGADDDS